MSPYFYLVMNMDTFWHDINKKSDKIGLVISGLSLVLTVLFATLGSLWISIASAFIAISALLFVLSRTLLYMKGIIEDTYPDNYKVLGAFVFHTTDEGNQYEYNTYKFIQNKSLFLYDYDKGFSWSGSNNPGEEDIESDIQEVISVSQTDGSSYDQAKMKFDRPLIYNESEVLHTRFYLDDSDDSASPHVSYKVKYNIRLIYWRVELMYKENNPPAIIDRQTLDSDTPSVWEEVDTTEFHKNSHSYTYYLLSPESGYHYRMHWDK